MTGHNGAENGVVDLDAPSDDEVAVDARFSSLVSDLRRSSVTSIPADLEAQLRGIFGPAPAAKQAQVKTDAVYDWLPSELSKVARDSRLKEKQLVEPFLETLLRVAPDFPLWTEKNFQETTLHLLVRAGQGNLIRFLCDQSPEAVEALSVRSLFQLNCLHIAIEQRRPPALVKYIIDQMLKKGKEAIEIGDQKNNTALHLAVDYEWFRPEQLKIVEYLVRASSDLLVAENGDRVDNGPAAVNGRKGAGPAGKKSKGKAPLQYHLETWERAIDPVSGRVREGIARPKESLEQLKEVAGKVRDFLAWSCIRLRLSRDKTLQLLYGDGPRKMIAFDLWGYSEISEESLQNLGSHLEFEKYLQCVVLPNLTVTTSDGVENGDSGTKPAQQQLPCRSGRRDYWRIFEWLRRRGVERILRVSVHDREPRSHSDDMIARCLETREVEMLDWNKLDVCATTLIHAVPRVRHLTLYCSGNNGVLRSWAASDGLVELPFLERLDIKINQGLESPDTVQAYIDAFERDLAQRRTAWCRAHRGDDADSDGLVCPHHAIAVTCEVLPNTDDDDPDAQSGAPSGKQELQEKQEWLRCMEAFAKFVEAYSEDRGLEARATRVALIDDGVDSLYADLGRNIVAGETYCTRNDDDYDSYYKSSRGHGTIMATLIRRMCPHVRLYVAKLDRKLTGDGKMEITAKSAREAVEWAAEQDVDLISMSWTINKTQKNQAEIQALDSAINRALQKPALLFCSVSDQGPKTDRTYPANCNRAQTFLIGTATRAGHGWAWNGENDVNYIFPGTELDVRTGDPLFDDLLDQQSHLGEGSSLATALAAGLAAVIVYAAALTDAALRPRVCSFEGMDAAFRSINHDQGRSRYLRVWDMFDEARKRASEPDHGAVLEDIVGRLLSHVPK